MKRRTHSCGELRKADIGKTVHLMGWVARSRNLGGLIFIDLRDRYGKTQVVVHPETNPEAAQIAQSLHAEWVIELDGTVYPRPEGMINANLSTGEIEVHVNTIEILNQCPVLPFQVEDAGNASEELRLKYRYLDLRRPEVQNTLFLRHRVSNIVRQHFSNDGFIEVETPILVKSTPEGARDYLVPSRVFPGQFYALPQSPQIYKQILMVAGFDKYFQICKCFRDEDLRSDRQPEFTQIDIEMTFVDRDTIFDVAERLFQKVLKEVWDVNLKAPFPRLTFNDVMEGYGSDKPDLRYGLKFSNVTEWLKNSEFQIVANSIASGGEVIGLNLPAQAELSRKQFSEIEELAKSSGLQGILPIRYKADGFNSPLLGKISDENLKKIADKFDAKIGDLILLAVGKKSQILKGLGVLRIKLAEKFELFDKNDHNNTSLFWVVDFPLFERDEETGDVAPSHHPFTGFNPEDAHKLESEPWNVRSLSYDLVMNGNELISGSIRIHDPIQQAKIFDLLGISRDEIELRFGFLIDALRYGAPPMGGCAIGLDRLIMCLTGGTIRDVIAFPKTNLAQSLMDGCPSPVDPKLLNDLKVKVTV